MNSLLEVGVSNAAVATILALIAACVGRFARRPALAHTLWILVLLKLITPPFVHVPVRLPDIGDLRLSDAAFVPVAAPSATLAPSASEGRCDEPPLVLGANVPGAKWQFNEAAIEETVSEQYAETSDLPPADPPIVEANTATARLTEWASVLWLPVLLSAWGAGAVACWGIAGLRTARFHRLLRYGRPASAEIRERVRRLANQLGLWRCPDVLMVPGCISPLVWAVAGRARIVLPEHLLERLSPEEQDTLLAHELAHIYRHDHWVRWLELLAGGLFWWHPVAWWARRELQSLEEECCDAWVVWALPQAVRDYARALVETVDFLSGARPALPPAASGLGYVHHLKRRLTMILREPLYHRLSLPAALAVILFALLILPAGAHRLAAETTLPPAVAPVSQDASDDEDKPPSRDLDRRLRRLESQMDRVLRALESKDRSGKASDSSRGEGSQTEKQAEECASRPRRGL